MKKEPGFDNFFPNYAYCLLLLTLYVWQGDCGTPHHRFDCHKNIWDKEIDV